MIAGLQSDLFDSQKDLFWLLGLDWNLQADFEVDGAPAPKGSWKAVPIPDPKGYLLRSKFKSGFPKRLSDLQRVRVQLIPDNKKSKPYEKIISYKAAAEAPKLALKGTPVLLVVCFHVVRPKAHYRTTKALGTVLRSDAPELPTKKPDVDKYTRAVMDALTGIAYEDDSQVAAVVPFKIFDETGRGKTSIRIYSK